MLRKIKSFLSNENNAQWCLFLLFLLVVAVKCILFDAFCFSSVPGYFKALLFSLPQKIVPALFLAGFVFVTKRQWWTIIANLLIDTWCIANLFYFKANGIFLSYEAMKMVDNMDGFWSSLESYMGRDIVVFPIITLIYALGVYILADFTKSRQYITALVIVICSLLVDIGDQFMHNQYHQGLKESAGVTWDKTPMVLLPFSHAYISGMDIVISYNTWAKRYIKKYSIVGYFPAMFIYNHFSPAQGNIAITEISPEELTPYIAENKATTAKTNVVFILFESLESWPLNEVEGYSFLPNLSAISKDPHAFCCYNLKSQVGHGNSSDGQMIDLTGLLPISDGATCILYPTNDYPSYAQCFISSSIINPSPGAYEQERMTKAYHFKSLIEPPFRQHWEDINVMEKVINFMDTAQQPFCTLGITVSSHTPWRYGAEHPTYLIDGMPAKLSAYLNCLAYADSCIGMLLEHIKHSDKLAQNTTLVISGDHTIFRWKDKELDAYAEKANIDLRTTKTYTPLIIYSPLIEGNIIVTDTCYQMDVYPTILHLIGCEDYYWKGFGVNIMDSTLRYNRPISEKEAGILSNKLIRSNYFHSLQP
ncbi:MAG: LTA synthase family protein [Paludibacteraceae bacterium]|nr:LTA synthase family protein [Paludibacteraceae bacterium]